MTIKNHKYIRNIARKVGGFFAALSLSLPAMSAAQFDGKKMFVISDVDMSATAYANGVLHPLESAQDTLTSLTLPYNGDAETSRSYINNVSNSVLGWPMAMASSDSGEFVYIAETRGQVAKSVTKVGSVFTDLPDGSFITVVQQNDSNSNTIEQVAVGTNPGAIALSHDENWLIASIDVDKENSNLAVLKRDKITGKLSELTHARIGSTADSKSDAIPIKGISWHATKPIMAVTFNDKEVAFYRATTTSRGGLSFVALGEPIKLGIQLAKIRFAGTSDYLVVTDVGWGGGAAGFLFNKPGHIYSIKLDEAGQHSVAGQIAVDLSPESFGISQDARHIVAVNMRRTYLGCDWRIIGCIWPGHDKSSLSLLSFDHDTGQFATLDEVKFEGLLPEDAIFDSDGDMIAVTVFHYREKSDNGFVTFFRITEEQKLIEENSMRLAMPRGVHGLSVIW